jgi:Ca-activated chloride channel family protein
MQRRAAIRDLMVAGAALFLAHPIAITHDRQDQKDFVIRSEVRLVLLDVSVQDRSGLFVEGLSKENFQVLENGVAQQITSFSSSDLPVTVGLLVDESRSMGPKRNEVLNAAGLFISGSNPKDEMFVLNFNDNVKRGLPEGMLFSDDATQLRTALSRGAPKGMTALNDAVVEGLTQVESGTRNKKALILISDGGDNASRHTRREMLSLVERSMATIYTIGLFEPGDPDRDVGLLKQLAHMSGGEAYFPEGPSGMEAVCTGIAKEIRTRYTIGFNPAANNGGPLRHLRVSVSAPGHSRLTARTRATYRYDETGTQGSK